jgi:hypothetical protein
MRLFGQGVRSDTAAIRQEQMWRALQIDKVAVGLGMNVGILKIVCSRLVFFMELDFTFYPLRLLAVNEHLKSRNFNREDVRATSVRRLTKVNG